MQYRASLKLDGKLPAHALMWRRETGKRDKQPHLWIRKKPMLNVEWVVKSSSKPWCWMQVSAGRAQLARGLAPERGCPGLGPRCQLALPDGHAAARLGLWKCHLCRVPPHRRGRPACLACGAESCLPSPPCSVPELLPCYRAAARWPCSAAVCLSPK